MNYAGALIWRGIFAVLFGVAALFASGVTVTVVIIWFGAFALISGIFTSVASVRAAAHHSQWGLLLMSGLLSIVVGLLAIIAPGQMAVAMVWVLGIWAVMTGVFEVAAALTSSWVMTNKGLLAFAGIISVLFGGLLIANPLAGVISLTWLMGIYAVMVGVMMLVLGCRCKKTAV